MNEYKSQFTRTTEIKILKKKKTGVSFFRGKTSK